jgi:LacI family transcriptional regulator
MDEFARSEFVRWFKRHKPDVVLGHWTPAIDWMRECGARIPETVGFVSLNVTTETRPCAGLDFRPRLLGARSAELLIAQLQRNERGIPSPASLTMIPALWRDGPTLVARS